MNDLVVGGAGFIGSQLCDALLAKGDNVVCLDNLMRGNLANISQALKNKHFSFIKEDATNERALEEILKERKIDFVYHLAANSDIQASANDPSIEFYATCSTTWSVLSSMRKSGVKKFFFASSSAVYGEMRQDQPFNELSEMNPISYYGSAKMASEAFISSFTYMNGFDSLIFRFPNVVGKRLTHGVVFDFICRLKDNPNELIVLGDGTQSKPYISADDLINAILLFSEKNKGKNVFEIGVRGSTSVRYVAENAIKEMGIRNCKIIYGNSKSGWKGDVSHFLFDDSKIQSFGWKATMNSDEAVLYAIRETIKSYANLDHRK